MDEQEGEFHSIYTFKECPGGWLEFGIYMAKFVGKGKWGKVSVRTNSFSL